MTKTFKLRLDDGFYKESKPLLCVDFVNKVLGATPDSLIAVISDESIEGAVELLVLKGGYYRWTWRFANQVYNAFGMRRFAEDELCSFFNEARNDSLDGERSLWLQIIP